MRVPILNKAEAHLEASPLEHWQLAPTDLEPEPLKPLEALQPLEASRAPQIFDSWQGMNHHE